MSRPSLNFSEWFLVCIFLGLMAAMVVVSKISSSRAKNTICEIKPIERIRVEVSGEVMKPGSYEIEVGSLYSEVLKKTRPKKFADLSQIHLDDPVDHLTAIVVPQLKEIRVRIVGEVSEACELFLKPGTRICELKSKIKFTEEADLLALRSRKMLSDGEEIRIEKRK